MYYRHEFNFNYPERSDEQMVRIKHVKDVNLDENYPYLDKSFWFKFKRAILWLFMPIGFLICTIRHGVKIHGRKQFKKYKKEFKNGAITIANHVLLWDYVCVLKAIRPIMQYHPSWKANIEGPNANIIRAAGGIPIPTDNVRAMAKFQKAIGEVLKDGKWLHFFPEGALWPYYPDIRPLKKAVFKYAVRYNKPVIPITISFRPRKGIMKLFGKTPLVDVNIGEPLYPDTSLPFHEAIDKIHKEAYHVMQVMVGVNPGDPTYNTDQNIETYKKTM